MREEESVQQGESLDEDEGTSEDIDEEEQEAQVMPT